MTLKESKCYQISLLFYCVAWIKFQNIYYKLNCKCNGIRNPLKSGHH